MNRLRRDIRMTGPNHNRDCRRKAKVARMQVLSDGLELAVDVYGSGPPLVFAHGLTDSRHVSLRQLARLAASHTLVVFDQRGHGDSTSITDLSLYSPERTAADIVAVMDSLDLDQAIIGGEPMGAATALSFALECPERVHSLLLLGPAFGDTLNPARERLKRFGRLLAGAGVEALIQEMRQDVWREVGLTNETTAAIEVALRSHDSASLSVACQAVAEWIIPQLCARLGTLILPVMIVAWEGDPVHSVELARRLAAQLPHAQLEILPSYGQLGNEPELAGRLFQRFLLS